MRFLGRRKESTVHVVFSGTGKIGLGAKGLLTEIDVPYPAAGSKSVYLKHAVRGAMDIAMVGVAVLITPDAGEENVQDVRIGLGAVAPTPMRAPKTGVGATAPNPDADTVYKYSSHAA